LFHGLFPEEASPSLYAEETNSESAFVTFSPALNDSFDQAALELREQRPDTLCIDIERVAKARPEVAVVC
jgi:hypothetical protein